MVMREIRMQRRMVGEPYRRGGERWRGGVRHARGWPQVLDKASANRTSIFVAHKLSLVQDADLILVCSTSRPLYTQPLPDKPSSL